MKNVTITEISGSDVDFDQTIDSDEVTALAGGIAVNGSVQDSAFNTGRNSGIMSGDDTTLENSTVGNGNVQFNDSTVGAFAQGGSATNIQGENLNLGSGDLIDVDTGSVIEFSDAEHDALARAIAAKLGFELVQLRLELFGRRPPAPAPAPARPVSPPAATRRR